MSGADKSKLEAAINEVKEALKGGEQLVHFLAEAHVQHAVGFV